MRSRILTITAATIAAAALTAVAFSIPATAAPITPNKVSYIVIPHPDDEFQTAMMTQDSPDNYQVTITMTHGEQTSYCNPAALKVSLQAKEIPPTPLPTSQWSPSCDAARLNSWVGYMTEMSKTDPGTPGNVTDLGNRGPFPANGVPISRVDGGGKVVVDRTAHVWLDKQGRGALVAFDLGDGDLTPAEVSWAVKTVRDNRAALGLNTTLPNWNVLGAYSNEGYPGCDVYTHPDHRAVHVALWNTDFRMHYQAAATCKSDPDAIRTGTVDQAYLNAAFNPNGVTGAHEEHYGWLNETAYAVSRTNQSDLFMAPQSFWIRWAH